MFSLRDPGPKKCWVCRSKKFLLVVHTIPSISKLETWKNNFYCRNCSKIFLIVIFLVGSVTERKQWIFLFSPWRCCSAVSVQDEWHDVWCACLSDRSYLSGCCILWWRWLNIHLSRVLSLSLKVDYIICMLG